MMASSDHAWPALAGSARRRARPALTLVEVLLVLALLVVISAVSAPLLGGSLAHARLIHGGDLLRAAWGKARLAAMQSGEPYVFRYEQQGSRYQIVLLSALSDANAADATNALPEDDGDYSEADMLRISRSRLPEGVVFLSGQVAAVPQLAAAATATDTGWSTPIVFYADGTASDAVVLLASARGRQIRVTLRGLTGISRTSEVSP